MGAGRSSDGSPPAASGITFGPFGCAQATRGSSNRPEAICTGALVFLRFTWPSRFLRTPKRLQDGLLLALGSSRRGEGASVLLKHDVEVVIDGDRHRSCAGGQLAFGATARPGSLVWGVVCPIWRQDELEDR